MMRVLRGWFSRLVGAFSRRDTNDELREEMEAHLEMEIDELMRRGMDASSARRTALLNAGGLTQAAEAVHDQRGIPWLENVGADLRYAVRALRRAPAFTAVVMLTLALGIGANTAIFGAVRGVLLKPLPHRDGDQLVYLRHSRDGAGGESIAFSVPEVRDLRQGARSLAAIAELSNWTVTLQKPEGAERVQVGLVTGNWFEVMGLRPVLGRVTGAGDDGPGVPIVAVLTYEGWKRRFGGDSSIVGQKLLVDGKPATVIGVLQPAPFFPGEADAILNMAASEHHLSASMVEGRTHRMTEVVARLSPGATVAMAAREVSDVLARAAGDFPAAYPTGAHHRLTVIPFKTVMGEQAQLTLWLLMAAAAFVLVIAVANVANLTLMRGVNREHELIVRASLGAGASRLRRLLLAENLVIALAGATAGLLVAAGGTRLLAVFVARFSPRAAEVRLDIPAFVFTLAVAIAVALILSWSLAFPREGNFAAWLLSGGHRTSAGRRRNRLQRALVVVQVGATVVLLTGAGLLTRTLQQLSSVSTGLRTEEVLSMTVPILSPTQLLSDPGADAGAKVRYEQIRAEVAALPGVTAVGVGSPGPLRASDVRFDVKVDGRASEKETLPRAEYRTASPEFFEASGVPLERGRAFDATDGPGRPLVVIINRTLADQLFPGEDPIGQRIAWTGDVLRFTPISGGWRTIVGVVGNTRDGGLDAVPRLVVYQPFAQALALSGTLVVRSEGHVASLTPAATRIIRRIAPTAPIENVLTIAQIRDQSVAPRRVNAALISSFGLLALLVAAVGLAGVLAFSVSARTNEIGIRMSLGASARGVERMILREGGVLVGIGLAGGLVVAYFASGLMRGLLFGVAPHDPATMGGVAITMLVIGLVACWIPAARAARIDPSISMRAQ